MPIRPFTDTLREIERGHLLDTLADAQHEIIEGVRKTFKAGELTLKLKYKHEADGQLTIEADVKHKVPQMARGKTLFFMTPEGNLQREDPRQTRMDLRSVDEPEKSLKEAK